METPHNKTFDTADSQCDHHHDNKTSPWKLGNVMTT